MEKTGGSFGTFDAGAISNQTLAGDGYVECVAQATNNAFIGLSLDNPDANFTGMDLAAYLTTTLYTWEQTGGVFAERSTLSPGDIVRVRRTGTTVTVEKNGSTVHTFAGTMGSTPFVDTSIGDLNAVLGDIKLYDAGVQVAITWASSVNVTLTQP